MLRLLYTLLWISRLLVRSSSNSNITSLLIQLTSGANTMTVRCGNQSISTRVGMYK